MKKTVLIVLGVIAVVVGFLIFTQPKSDTSGTPSEHKIGASTSGVVLIEYGDFQCPYCGQYYPVLKQVKEYYGDEIAFQFRHFPLESSHKNARAAAMAAEAAGLQGKFWEMHDKLFETQNVWSETVDPVGTFEGFAKDIGVADLDKFKVDYRSSVVKATINADMDVGRGLGVNSTPSFVIDNKKLDPTPGMSFEAFKEIIDAEIKKKTGKDPVSGTSQTPATSQEAAPAGQ